LANLTFNHIFVGLSQKLQNIPFNTRNRPISTSPLKGSFSQTNLFNLKPKKSMSQQKIFFKLIALCLFIIGQNGFIHAQKRALVDDSQKSKLEQLAAEWQQEFMVKKAKAIEKAVVEGWPIRGELEDGTVYEIVDYEGNLPEYRITNNTGAARSVSTNHLHPGGSSGLNLSGAGMIVGEWDGGATLLTHQEFGGRAIQRDGATSLSSHATHVAGTLIGAGVRADAKGMAPEAILWTHDWNNDNAEMASAAADGLLISNHSYGSISGWARGDWSESGLQEWHWWGDVAVDEEEDLKFGWYNTAARQWDLIAENAPYYLIVKSAGNDRNDNGTTNHKVRQGSQWVASNAFRQRDGGTDGYDCIPTNGNAKNILTIGAVNKIANGWSRPSDVTMSSFSGWGPTDDGRIKPDLVGAGVGLLSSNSSGPTGYNSSSGTSMSGPNVAGSLILLQELHERLYGKFMKASTLKGLAIHTADPAGVSDGPDYRFGWGMLNTAKAANVLNDPLYNKVMETTLKNGEELEYIVYADGENPVKITISWTDPAAQASGNVLNDRNLKLINDLDIRLISSSDEEIVFMPYILDPANPNAPADTGDNFRDNMEVINAGVIEAGEYRLVVTHKGNLRNGAQDFSLIISAPIAACLLSDTDPMVENLFCADDFLDSITVEMEDGNGPYLFSYGGEEEFSENNVFSNLGKGTHYIFIKDANECIGLQRVEINTPPPIQVSLLERFVFSTETANGIGENLPFAGAEWGGNLDAGLLSGKLVLVDDGSANPDLGCGSLVNSDEINGKIALVRRGACEFGTKAFNAQQAGAKAVIIINTDPGTIAMGAGSDGPNVNIPVFMIGSTNGNNLLNQLSENENLRFVAGNLPAVTPESCDDQADGFVSPIVAGGAGGYNFLWSNGSTTSSLTATAGTYELSISDANGCQLIWEVEIPGTVIPTPVLSVGAETCAGDENGRIRIININQFNGLNTSLNNGMQGSNFTGLPAGTYDLTIATSSGCESVITIDIAAGPNLEVPIITGSPEVIFGSTFTYYVEENPEIEEYNWSAIGGEIIDGQGTNEIVLLIDEDFDQASIALEVRINNCRKSNSLDLEAITTSLNEISLDHVFQLFPNPARNTLFIDMKTQIPLESNTTIEVLDINGMIIQKLSAEDNRTINISHLTPGTYMVKIGSSVKRFVKM